MIDNLIKSEAIDYAQVFIGTRKFAPYQNTLDDFTAGFNRCLEMAKMDNDKSFDNWWSECTHDFNHEEMERVDTEYIWQAATQLKNVRIKDLESKLMVAAKALEDYASGKVFTGETAKLALLKVKDGEGV